jgi:hypothetical protein
VDFCRREQKAYQKQQFHVAGCSIYSRETLQYLYTINTIVFITLCIQATYIQERMLTSTYLQHAATHAIYITCTRKLHSIVHTAVLLTLLNP